MSLDSYWDRLPAIHFLLCVLAASTFAIPTAFPDSSLTERSTQSFASRNPGGPSSASSAKAHYATLPIDHFSDNCSRTFKNRYYVNDKFYKPGGPVFIIDVGEFAIVDGNVQNFMGSGLDGSSYPTSVFKKFNGLAILLEHRYFGESSPVSIHRGMDPKDLQYLTVEQALADIPTFATQFSLPKYPNDDFSPAERPWIFVGSSYSGQRAAIARDRYPDIIYASWAAAAPVHSEVDESEYYLPVLEAVQAFGFTACSKDVTAALQYVDRELDDEKSALAIKQRFLGSGAKYLDNYAFAGSLREIFSTFQISGIDSGATKDPNYSITDFCDWLEHDPWTNSTAPAEGWAKSRGAKFVVKRWSSWKPYIKALNANAECKKPFTLSKAGGGCAYSDAAASDDKGIIALSWFACNQFGWFQSAGPATQPITSRHYDYDSFFKKCANQFPGAIESGILPATPQAEALNKKFGSWNLNPSNTFWTDGQYDPWRPQTRLTQRFGVPHPTVTQEPSECDQAYAQDQIFGYVVPNGTHGTEFSPVLGGPHAQDLWVGALEKWIPCFRPKSKDDIVSKYSQKCS